MELLENLTVSSKRLEKGEVKCLGNFFLESIT